MAVEAVQKNHESIVEEGNFKVLIVHLKRFELPNTGIDIREGYKI